MAENEEPISSPVLDRRKLLAALLGSGMAGFTGCMEAGNRPDDDQRGTDDNGNDSDPGEPTPDRHFLPFRIGEDGFEVDGVDGFEQFYVQGVNIGMGVPGHFPGAAALSRDQYARWLKQIGDLHANAIRVYTIHPPAFYEELAAYNRAAADPLYLFHGTWIGESTLRTAGDVTEVTDEFQQELRRTVDVIHGEAEIDVRAGHASGTYTADVSDYLLGYIAGIEWPPSVVIKTNEAGGDGDYQGRFIETIDASPFERWLAECLDDLAAHAVDTYDTQRPLAFVNWPTTDPLDHPYEPFELEDAVSVHPDAIQPTDAFDAGTFGAYHIYPYYPPFMNHTPEYLEYTDHRGEQNSYAGYLNALQNSLDVPLLVAELGVPDSRALAAKHVHSRHQGRHTEAEQGTYVAAMIEDLAQANTAGGLIFAWHDEWFKRTWNLAPFSDSSGRPRWSNVQTPEQRFGLLTFDPAGTPRLDGSGAAWADAQQVSPHGSPKQLDAYDDQRTFSSAAITHDEAYLSIRLEFTSLADLDWSKTHILLTIGHTGRGNTSLDLGLEATVEPTDFIIRLAGPDDSRVRVDAYYDAFAWEFGDRAGLELSKYREKDAGRFTPIRVATNSGYEIPATGENIPFAPYETGRLRYGTADPDAPDYDSLTDVHVAPDANAIELRLPWQLLNIADPSTRRSLGDFWEEESITFEELDSLSIAAGTYVPAADGTAQSIEGETNFVHTIPGVDDGTLKTIKYDWPMWSEPEYTERLKESYRYVQDAFGD